MSGDDVSDMVIDRSPALLRDFKFFMASLEGYAIAGGIETALHTREDIEIAEIMLKNPDIPEWAIRNYMRLSLACAKQSMREESAGDEGRESDRLALVIESQQATINSQQATIESQQATIESQQSKYAELVDLLEGRSRGLKEVRRHIGEESKAKVKELKGNPWWKKAIDKLSKTRVAGDSGLMYIEKVEDSYEYLKWNGKNVELLRFIKNTERYIGWYAPEEVGKYARSKVKKKKMHHWAPFGYIFNVENLSRMYDQHRCELEDEDAQFGVIDELYPQKTSKKSLKEKIR